MPRKAPARIVGLGSYLPKRVLSNADLEKMVDTTDEWIFTRTGMRERRIAGARETTSDLGVEAAKAAVEDSGLSLKEIDYILVATMTPDYITPSTAAIIQAKLGLKEIPALDTQSACSGFLYGLSLAQAYVEAGKYQNILVVAAEKMSAFVDYEDRTTCVLFGDGASAAVVSGEGKGFAIDTLLLGADGCLAELMIIPGGGAKQPASADTLAKKSHTFKMEGKEVFKHAVRRMVKLAKECLSDAKLEVDDIRWVIPHQANVRIIDAIAKNLRIPDSHVVKTVYKYGNTSGSTIGIALDELVKEQPIKSGEHLLLLAFGAGLTWGAAVLTKI